MGVNELMLKFCHDGRLKKKCFLQVHLVSFSFQVLL